MTASLYHDETTDCIFFALFYKQDTLVFLGDQNVGAIPNGIGSSMIHNTLLVLVGLHQDFFYTRIIFA